MKVQIFAKTLAAAFLLLLAGNNLAAQAQPAPAKSQPTPAATKSDAATPRKDAKRSDRVVQKKAKKPADLKRNDPRYTVRGKKN
jgi:hypothetical protein